MRRLSYRVATALWGVWFAAALVGPATLHACPEHASVTHTSNASVAHHDGHSDVIPEQSQTPAHTADADCNCLGECSAVSAIEVAKSPANRAESVITRSRLASIRNVETPAVSHDYEQPFANGPPSAFASA